MRAGNAIALLLVAACGGKETPTTSTATGSGAGSGSAGATGSAGLVDDIDTLPASFPHPAPPADQCAKFVTRVIHATWPELHRNGATITQADVDTETTACRTNDAYPRKKDIGCVFREWFDGKTVERPRPVNL